MSQSGASVAGTYRVYGRGAEGSLTGTVVGNTLSGTYAGPGGTPTGSFTFTLASGGQSFTGMQGATQWCGVPSGSGALPSGCGFSGQWDFCNSGQPNTVVQSHDVVSFNCYLLTMQTDSYLGIVSDSRVNGVDFHFTLLPLPEQKPFSIVAAPGYDVFSGNVDGTTFGARRVGSTATFSADGGGPFDGAWYTNTGVLDLTQVSGSTAVSGSFYVYGTPALEGTVSGIQTGNTMTGSISLLGNTRPFAISVGYGFLGAELEGSSLNQRWCGGRGTSALTPGCGFSTGAGDAGWIVSGMLVPYTRLQLTQNRDQVTASGIGSSTLSGVVDSDGYTFTGDWFYAPTLEFRTAKWFIDTQYTGQFRGHWAGTSGIHAWCGYHGPNYSGPPTTCLQ